MSKFVTFLFVLLCGVVAVCVSSSQAFLYFLPDYEDNVIVSSSCHRQGYKYNRDNCPSPRVLENKCPSDDWYRTCACYGSESCTGDSAETNPFPIETGSVRTSCEDCGGNLLYSWQCSPSGECDSYDLTDCPEQGYCSQCCDGFYKLESCASGYEVVGDVCELKETCFGEETRESGADYSCTDCETKEGKTLYTCECVGNCNLESCPLYGTCSSDCKGNYCLTGCQEGYKLNSSETGCIDECDKVQEGCDTGYEFVNQCVRKSDGKTYGDCVDCKDETAFSNQCKGYYTCSGDGRTPDGDPLCYCGNVPYYERCLVEETCFSSNSTYNANGGWCKSFTSTVSGWYFVADKCTKLDGTQVQYWTQCNTTKDCAGETPPCAGMEVCEAGVEPECTCGGVNYCTPDPCNDNKVTTKEGSCFSVRSDSAKYQILISGMTYLRDKCVKKNGVTVELWQHCVVTDCDGNEPPCSGFQVCESYQTPECVCGGVNYCTPDPCSNASVWVDTNNRCFAGLTVPGGYRYVKDKCTRQDGQTMKLYTPCTDSINDCDGNPAPCAGYSTCPSGTFIGTEDTCECGGVTYGKTCLAECNYEETEETCTAAGKSFSQKCKDANDIWYGECI